MKFTPDYFIKKFDAIPESKWTTNAFKDKNGCKCALGHCGFTTGKPTPEGFALAEWFRFIKTSVISVNDGFYRELGSTPKERILNALLHIKALEELGGL